MDEAYEIELALRNAVDKKKDFYHSADWISSIIGNISYDKERQKLCNDLIDFLKNYPSPTG
jgi:hypothetical protein